MLLHPQTPRTWLKSIALRCHSSGNEADQRLYETVQHTDHESEDKAGSLSSYLAQLTSEQSLHYPPSHKTPKRLLSTSPLLSNFFSIRKPQNTINNLSFRQQGMLTPTIVMAAQVSIDPKHCVKMSFSRQGQM